MSLNQLKEQNEVRFRCPHCHKLYNTHSDVFLGEEPVFDCISCHKSFFLSVEKNEIGLFMTHETRQGRFSICPKCSHLKPYGQDECPSCGVLGSKYEEFQKSESPTLFELNQLWQKVMMDFTLEESHQKFINTCHQKMALNFAYNKYSDLKNTLGYDMACEHYMRQVELRLEQQFQKEETHLVNQAAKNQLTRSQKIYLTVGVSGVALLIYNKIIPTFPNLTGLVVAVTVLSFGLVFFSAEYPTLKK